MSFGESYVYPFHVAVLFAIWFFVRGMRDAVLTFVSAYGLYWQTRNKAIAETVVLVLTVALMTKWVGIEGLLIANIFVQVFISLLVEAVKLFKHGLKMSPLPYFGRVLCYGLATFVLTVLSCTAVYFLPGSGIGHFLVGGIVSVAIGFGGFSLFFWHTSEFKMVKSMGLGLVRGFLKKRG